MTKIDLSYCNITKKLLRELFCFLENKKYNNISEFYILNFLRRKI